MSMPIPPVNPEDIKLFSKLIDENRFDLCKLVYIIFPFGQKGHPLEFKKPYDWQMEELAKYSAWLQNPATRYQLYRLIISSGNGAAKTALGAMILIMLMYTQRLKARITANTDPQMKTVVWPEYDKWFRHARFHDHLFEKFGTSIKAKNPELADTWRIDTITWAEETPTAISGLHNEGFAVAYGFEEAPGIPGNIWRYANGAFTEKNTIKFWFAFGNSDDPESKFEQNMASPLWNSRRIDTRTLDHIDPQFSQDLLADCGGDEDHDDFRTRVRGLPRKTAKDSIIRIDVIESALERGKDFDKMQVTSLPCILTCDPAWTGGDDTTIAYAQGHYAELLEKYQLDKNTRDTHMLTYLRLCHYERELGADLVVIDQAEGTAVYTLAVNAGKTNWILVAFNQSPTDHPIPKQSEFGNIRGQMYYSFADFLAKGGALGVRPELIAQEKALGRDVVAELKKQLAWAKGDRHKITGKKMVESKVNIKKRVDKSPDIADGLVLTRAYKVEERLPENDHSNPDDRFRTGQEPYKMPEHGLPYDDVEADYKTLYD